MRVFHGAGYNAAHELRKEGDPVVQGLCDEFAQTLHESGCLPGQGILALTRTLGAAVGVAATSLDNWTELVTAVGDGMALEARDAYAFKRREQAE